MGKRKIQDFKIANLQNANLYLTPDSLNSFWSDGPVPRTILNQNGIPAKSLIANRQFAQQLVQDKQGLLKFLIMHEAEINKEKFLLELLMNYEEKASRELSSEEKKEYDEGLREIKKELRGIEETLISYEVDTETGKIVSITVFDIKDIVRGKIRIKKEANVARLQSIEEQENFGNILQSLNMYDIEYIIPLKDKIGKALSFMIKYNTLVKEANCDSKTLEGRIKQYGFNTLVEQINNSKFIEDMVETLRKYITEIDLDKLLLCSAIRYIEAMEYKRIDAEDTSEVYRRLQFIRKHLEKGAKITISAPGYPQKTYEIKDLDNEMKRFIGKDDDKTYISTEQCNELKMRLMLGDISLKDFTVEMFEALALTKPIKEKLLRKFPENYIFFLRQEKQEYRKETILRDIIKAGSCSRDLLHLLAEKTDITVEEILNLFEQEIISVEDLTSLREVLKKPIITNRKIFEKYKQYNEQTGESELESQKSHKAKLDLERYALAYKMTEIVGKPKEEILIKGEEFITEVGDEIDTTDLVPLYSLGIIPLQIAVDWGGKNIIEQLVSSESLKPADAKSLYNEGLLDIQTLEKLLKDCENMSYAYQFMLVNTIFDGEKEEDRLIKDMLAQYYHINGALTNSAKKGVNSTQNKNGREEDKKTKAIVRMRDPGAKFNLLSSIDKGYYIESGIIDGHMIFHYPNIEGGTVLIEKMHKVTTNRKSGEVEIKADNESATYVMSEEEFAKIKLQLIKDGRIDRTQLTQRWWITRDPNHWIAHTGKSGWEDSIQELFNINATNSRYSPEDLAKFEELRKKSIDSKSGSGR